MIYGVGYGGSLNRQWENKHFETESDAQQFMTLQYESFKQDFSRIGQYIVRAIDTEITIRNVKKNGNLGAFSIKIRLYSIDQPCGSWGCSACKNAESSQKHQGS